MEKPAGKVTNHDILFNDFSKKGCKIKCGHMMPHLTTTPLNDEFLVADMVISQELPVKGKKKIPVV